MLTILDHKNHYSELAYLNFVVFHAIASDIVYTFVAYGKDAEIMESLKDGDLVTIEADSQVTLMGSNESSWLVNHVAVAA